MSSPPSTTAQDNSSHGPPNEPLRRPPRDIVTICPKCHGESQTRARRRSKKSRYEYQRQCKAAEEANLPPPTPPPVRYEPCKHCHGSGLVVTTVVCEDDDSVCCPDNNGTSSIAPNVDQNVVRIAIIGGGIGGLALALALQHRNISCTVYERDSNFSVRSQGYGLTMQQGARALRSLGFFLNDNGKEESSSFGIHSKRHAVHLPDGTQVGEWGMKVWGRPDTKAESARRQNAHVARQELRRMLLDKLEPGVVKWGYRLLDYKELPQHIDDDHGETGREVELTLQTTLTSPSSSSGGTNSIVKEYASVLVGADGIRSSVRKCKLGDTVTPLRYLGCIVILGIASSPRGSELTNGETVFQTADGTTRLYAMPYAKVGEETAGAANFTKAAAVPAATTAQTDDPDGCNGENEEEQVGGNGGSTSPSSSSSSAGETMWQLSFPLREHDAKELSRRGPAALKAEAIRRCGSWHDPIPRLLNMTPVELISGYPVYDRELLSPEQLRRGGVERRRRQRLSKKGRGGDDGDSAKDDACSVEEEYPSRVTLLGDAAHPMSPFKGQGANQALLDAVLLARSLYKAFRTKGIIDRKGTVESAPLSSSLTVSSALAEFEVGMLKRSAAKVKASAEAARFLHSDLAVSEGNVTRGAAAAAASVLNVSE